MGGRAYLHEAAGVLQQGILVLTSDHCYRPAAQQLDDFGSAQYDSSIVLFFSVGSPKPGSRADGHDKRWASPQQVRTLSTRCLNGTTRCCAVSGVGCRNARGVATSRRGCISLRSAPVDLEVPHSADGPGWHPAGEADERNPGRTWLAVRALGYLRRCSPCRVAHGVARRAASLAIIAFITRWMTPHFSAVSLHTQKPEPSLQHSTRASPMLLLVVRETIHVAGASPPPLSTLAAAVSVGGSRGCLPLGCCSCWRCGAPLTVLTYSSATLRVEHLLRLGHVQRTMRSLVLTTGKADLDQAAERDDDLRTLHHPCPGELPPCPSDGVSEADAFIESANGIRQKDFAGTATVWRWQCTACTRKWRSCAWRAALRTPTTATAWAGWRSAGERERRSQRRLSRCACDSTRPSASYAHPPYVRHPCAARR